jgi:hypothetical protein
MNLAIIMLLALALGALLLQQFKALAIILVVIGAFIWHRIFRSTPGEPFDTADLDAMDVVTHEASATFTPAEIPSFFARIAPHFPRGFGENEIERLVTLASILKPGRETRTELHVEFLGESTPLRIHMKKQADGKLALQFTSTEAVAGFLTASISAVTGRSAPE